jgi:hypothetical protein
LGSLASNNERLEEIVVTCEEDLLKFMNSDFVKDLPCQFGTTIIQKHFLSNDKPIATTHLHSFMFNFFITRDKYERIHVLKVIFRTVDQCVNEDQIYELFDLWYKPIMLCKNDPKLIVDFFEKKIHVVENFARHVRLKLDTSLSLSFDDTSMRISVFVNEVMAAHGPYVINILSQEANASVDSFATQEICSYDYYHHLIKYSSTPLIAILVLKTISVFAEDDARSQCTGGNPKYT